MKTLILLFLFSFLLLTGCNKVSYELIKTESTLIKITNFDPPKYTYIDFTDLSNNQKYEHFYLSKHCYGCQDNQPLNKTLKVNIKTIKKTVCDKNNNCSITIYTEYDNEQIKNLIQNNNFYN